MTVETTINITTRFDWQAANTSTNGTLLLPIEHKLLNSNKDKQ